MSTDEHRFGFLNVHLQHHDLTLFFHIINDHLQLFFTLRRMSRIVSIPLVIDVVSTDHTSPVDLFSQMKEMFILV